MNLKSISTTLLLLNSVACQLFESVQLSELNLTNTLFRNYLKSVRPESVMNMKFIVFLKNLISIDEKNQIMTTSLNLYELWTDPRLTWDPAKYHNVSSLLIPAKELWLPDTAVTNSADQDIFLHLSDFNKALVYPNGTVNVVYPVSLLRTRCALNTDKFPFDEQKCPIQLTLWSTSLASVNLNNESFMSDEFYSENAIWELKGISHVSGLDSGRFEYFDKNYFTGTISFNIEIKRRPLYFMVNAIFPGIVLNFMTLLSFGIPSSSQFQIGMTIFLTFSVNSVRISGEIPVDSTYLPTISYFFLISIMFTVISFSWFVLKNLIRSWNFIPMPLNTLCEYIKNSRFGFLTHVQSKANQVPFQGNTLKDEVGTRINAENQINTLSKVDFNLITLNRLAFLIVSFLMVTLNLLLWLSIAS